jgi:hypothetical protein
LSDNEDFIGQTLHQWLYGMMCLTTLNQRENEFSSRFVDLITHLNDADSNHNILQII